MSSIKSPITLNSESDEPIGEVCIANISTAERRKRLTFGIITLVVSLVLLALLMAMGADRLWRLPLILLFFGAATGYFQWHDKTCVGLANLNSRKIGDTMEKIEDAGELAQVRKQARRVQSKALIAAVPLTLIALILPVLH
ncbi:MAG: hypothetical protein ABI690_33850 [Chloroflexota bacterium]